MRLSWRAAFPGGFRRSLYSPGEATDVKELMAIPPVSLASSYTSSSCLRPPAFEHIVTIELAAGTTVTADEVDSPRKQVSAKCCLPGSHHGQRSGRSRNLVNGLRRPADPSYRVALRWPDTGLASGPIDNARSSPASSLAWLQSEHGPPCP